MTSTITMPNATIEVAEAEHPGPAQNATALRDYIATHNRPEWYATLLAGAVGMVHPDPETPATDEEICLAIEAADLAYTAQPEPPHGAVQLSWTPYTGPRGGHGWQSTETGRVLYRADKPGEHEHAGESEHDVSGDKRDETGKLTKESASAVRADVKPSKSSPVKITEKSFSTPEEFGSFLGNSLATAPGISEKQKAIRIKAANAVASKMPQGAIDHLRDSLREISACADMEEVTRSFYELIEEEEGEDDYTAGWWEKERGRLAVDGGLIAEPADNENGYRLTTEVEQQESARGVMAHELGHALDTVGGKFVFSTTAAFKRCFRDEIADGQLSDYATTNEQEGFAEFAQLLYGSDTSREEIEEKFPATLGFFEGLEFA